MKKVENTFHEISIYIYPIVLHGVLGRLVVHFVFEIYPRTRL